MYKRHICQRYNTFIHSDSIIRLISPTKAASIVFSLEVEASAGTPFTAGRRAQNLWAVQLLASALSRLEDCMGDITKVGTDPADQALCSCHGGWDDFFESTQSMKYCGMSPSDIIVSLSSSSGGCSSSGRC